MLIHIIIFTQTQTENLGISSGTFPRPGQTLHTTGGQTEEAGRSTSETDRVKKKHKKSVNIQKQIKETNKSV